MEDTWRFIAGDGFRLDSGAEGTGKGVEAIKKPCGVYSRLNIAKLPTKRRITNETGAPSLTVLRVPLPSANVRSLRGSPSTEWNTPDRTRNSSRKECAKFNGALWMKRHV